MIGIKAIASGQDAGTRPANASDEGTWNGLGPDSGKLAAPPKVILAVAPTEDMPLPHLPKCLNLGAFSTLSSHRNSADANLLISGNGSILPRLHYFLVQGSFFALTPLCHSPSTKEQHLRDNEAAITTPYTSSVKKGCAAEKRERLLGRRVAPLAPHDGVIDPLQDLKLSMGSGSSSILRIFAQAT